MTVGRPDPTTAATDSDALSLGPPGATAPSEPNPLAVNSPSSPLLQHLEQAHDNSAARYAKFKEAGSMLAATSKQLEGLTKLGDTVTQEDVIKSTAKLVAAGGNAAALAGLLADMPDGGEALAAWVAQRAQRAQATAAKLRVMTGFARHQAGVDALRALIGHAMMPQGDELGPSPSVAGPGTDGGNPLAAMAAGMETQ